MGPSPRTLVLLTNTYPFGTGEEFIENEIGYLADQFDRVVVLATQVTDGGKPTRTLPDRVVAHDVTAAGPATSALGVLGIVTQALPRLVDSRTAIGRAFGSPRTFLRDAYFEARSQLIFQRITATVPLSEFQGSVSVYSFWFHVTARVGELLADALRRRGTPVAALFSRAHRYDLYEEANPGRHIPQRRPLLNAYDEVSPISADGVRYLQERYPATASKVTLHRLGTRDHGVTLSRVQRPCHVTSCSSLVEAKRMHLFAPVLQAVAGTGVKVVWTHLGGSGQDLENLRRQATQAAPDVEIRLLGDQTNPQVIEHHLSQPTTLLLNLSSSEGVPVSIMEAMSLGIPIVATAVGGVAEVVEDGGNGATLPADFTMDQAVEALSRVVEADGPAYEAMCRRSREIWEERSNSATVYPTLATRLRGPA